jgi:transcriptional regulator with XRE-family HTH domain
MISAINRALRAARVRHRFTFRELAKVTGLHFARIHQIEHGARPSPIEARLLVAALQGDITVADLQTASGAGRGTAHAEDPAHVA